MDELRRVERILSSLTQAAAAKPLTVDQFLDWDSGDDGRYDLLDGEIVAMAPTKPSHQIMIYTHVAFESA